MKVPEAGQHHQTLVDARVVLHRAGPERIEARVDPEVASRELGEVPQELGLRELREARRLGPAELFGDLDRRQVLAGGLAAAPAGLRLLEDELHPGPSASTSR